MPELLTLGVARTSSELLAAAGNCGNGDQFRDYVNRATRVLMRRGGFWGTVQPLNVCIYNQCITWPRYVGTVLATNFCGRNVSVWNNWFQFVPIGPGGVHKMGFRIQGENCFGNVNVTNDGTTPVFQNVPCGKARYIRAYTSFRADIGKKIRIFGIDSNGQTIRTKDAAGVWNEGVELTLPDPSMIAYASTPFTVREITRVIKDVTSGMLRLFQYDADDNTLHDCAAYDPSETQPDYRHSRIQGYSQLCCPGSCNSLAKSLQALVKLDFVAATADTDLVLIPNLDALAFAIQWARANDAQEKDAESKMLSAVHELNLELRDKFPVEQTPISVNGFGTALPIRHRIGRVV